MGELGSDLIEKLEYGAEENRGYGRGGSCAIIPFRDEERGTGEEIKGYVPT